MTRSQQETDRVPASSFVRHRIHEIIFEADTAAGLVFDVLLLGAILLSVVAICLETVESLHSRYAIWFETAEWCFTVLFTVEYLLRLYCVKRPLKYAGSFFGIIDLFAILPSYAALLLVNAPHFAVVRAFRLLRVFRIFKLIHFMKEADELGRAIMRARTKIVVFIGVVVVAVTVAGTLMYEIENWSGLNRSGESLPQDDRQRQATIDVLKSQIELALVNDQFQQAQSLANELANIDVAATKSKFRNIPESMYWATVTMTTVGYGDIVPTTTLGKFVAAILILLGYSLIIVPTGFVSAEFVEAKRSAPSTQACRYCMLESHDRDAVYCKGCGQILNGHQTGPPAE